MTYQTYLNQKRELYYNLFQFIDNENNDDEEYDCFIQIINKQKILEDKKDLEIFIEMIVQIANNHHFDLNFYGNIKKIVQFLAKSIKQTFTNSNIYELFKSNKRIMLYLIEQKILLIDEQISDKMILRSDITGTKYHFFFYQKINEFLNEKDRIEIENENKEELKDFDRKCQEGENDSYISELIRNDSIEEFVSYVNQTNLSLLRTKIKDSIFETNSFLLKNQPSLIEYAAFFGSLRIFQYLRFNGIDLEPQIWLYAIHGKNNAIIHLLEDYHVQPPNGKYDECLAESIKCHHNDISNYIRDNLIVSDDIEKNGIILKSIFKSRNFEMIPDEIKGNEIFFYLCHYNYSKLVKLYIEPKRVKIIQNKLSDTEILYLCFIKIIKYRMQRIRMIQNLFMLYYHY